MTKKFISIYFSLLMMLPFAVHAQFVNIPDPNFATWLNDNVGCVVGEQLDTVCSAIYPTSHSIDCSSNPIHDITGIQYFKGLTSFNCGFDSLTFVPTLPDSLQSLICQHNQISSINSLPTTLQLLDCDNNQLSFLPLLPQNLVQLNCGWNQLSNLPALPAGLQDLECISNSINSLPALPDSLLDLSCNLNHLSSLPFLPEHLGILECYDNQLSSLPALPASLYWLFCDYNQLTEIPNLPDSMEYFTCSYNRLLTCLPELKKISHILQFDSTNIKCLPNYGSVALSSPPLNTLPLCDSINPNDCPLVSAIVQIKRVNFSMYPNPTHDYVTISIDATATGDKLQVLNLMGEEISTTTITSSEYRLPVAALPAGLYLFKITDNNGRMGVGRFVKE